MCGMDRTPWVAEVAADGNELVLERDVSDSGTVTVPWHVEGHGLLALSTGTLIERWEPYHLTLELARGTIHLLRSQLYEWQTIGLTVPNEVENRLREALLEFSAAVVRQDEDNWETAQNAIRIALDGSQLLAAAYADQLIAARRRATGRLPAFLGGTLNGPAMDDDASRSFLSAFNMAMVPLYWRDVEASEGSFDWSACDRQVDWCRAQGLRICLGPLLQPDARGLPDWVYLWDDDYDCLMAAAGQFIEAAVKRYRDRVDLWLCAARVNSAANRGLDCLPREATRSGTRAVGRHRSALGRVPGPPRLGFIANPFCRCADSRPPRHQGVFAGNELRLFQRRFAVAERNRRQPAPGILEPSGSAAAGGNEYSERRRRRRLGATEDRFFGWFVEPCRPAGLGGKIRAADPQTARHTSIRTAA
jgi:hypothetical protein